MCVGVPTVLACHCDIDLLLLICTHAGKPNRTKDGHDVRTVKVADRTGCMNVSVWDQVGDALQTGDICRFQKG